MNADSTLTTAELTQTTAAADDMAPYLSSVVGDDLADGEDALWHLLTLTRSDGCSRSTATVS